MTTYEASQRSIQRSRERYPGERDIIEAWQRGLRPEPLLTVSEWADTHRKLSARGSNEPGPWRTSRTPYLRGIMDALSPSHPAQRVIFMKGVQVGATECGLNFIGYVIHHAPGPMLAVYPTVELAKRASKQRLAPLIAESPVLRSLVPPARAQDSGNNMLAKEFPGGILVLSGANTGSNLRSMPVRYLFLDEVDAYPQEVDDEKSDPVSLAIVRTDTFTWRCKVYMCSTPTIKGMSRIEREYEASDRRRYFVPCPHCGHKQFLQFKHLRWPKGKPEQAAYECEDCGAPIEEHHKTRMLASGEWIGTSDDGNPGVVGFHLSALYSPIGWRSWGRIARDWDAAQSSPTDLRGVINTALGETWELRGEAPDIERLMLRREDYPMGQLPPGALVLTCGIDVQARYLQYEVVGWGAGLESWSIDVGTVDGDTSQDAVWTGLAEVLARRYSDHNGNEWPIDMAAIDAGYNTQAVYHFVRKHKERLIATKGMPGKLHPILGTAKPQEVNVKGKYTSRGIMLWPIGDWSLKAEFYSFLRKAGKSEGLDDDPPGYCHFSTWHDKNFFDQLTAEHLVTHVVRGRSKDEWVLMQGRKNEALDCRKLARVAAEKLGISKMTQAKWWALAEQRGNAAPKPAEPMEAAQDVAAHPQVVVHAPIRPQSRPAEWVPDVRDGWL